MMVPALRIIGLLASAWALALIVTVPAQAQPTVIRVGGPSSLTEDKVAVIVSDRNLRGGRFRVRDSDGRTVFTGPIQQLHGLHRPWKHAFKVNFSSLKQPGRYRVVAAGVESRPWVVKPGGSAAVILRLLNFLETNRDGNETARLHGPSHLNDARLPGGGTVDLTGGWMDAGDMIHFTQTTALVSAELEAAARLSPGNAAALTEEADVGIRWLVKAHAAGSDLFIAQVAGEVDHEVLGFRDPAGDDSSGVKGISTRTAYPGVGSDVAGKVAAALAMAADRGSSAAPRNELIQLAREWYSSGRAAAKPLRGLPKDSGGFYLANSWKDDMAAGAAALFRSTGETAFLEQANQYLKGTSRVNGIGWIDNATFAAADICGGLGAPGLGSKAQRRHACNRLADAAYDARYNVRQDVFGMAGYMTWGTTAENAAFGAAAALAARAGIGPVGRNWTAATAARDWMLGRNQWGSSFVAGFGPRSPRNLHHWATVFGKGLPDGAVVGGPAPLKDVLGEDLRRKTRPFARFSTNRAVYEDLRVDYVTSEPAIDYTGASVLLFAALDR